MRLLLSVSSDLTRMSVGIIDQLGNPGKAAIRIRKRILKGSYTKLMVTSRTDGHDVYGDQL